VPNCTRKPLAWQNALSVATVPRAMDTTPNTDNHIAFIKSPNINSMMSLFDMSKFPKMAVSKAYLCRKRFSILQNQ
jgi:hypothetical protein